MCLCREEVLHVGMERAFKLMSIRFILAQRCLETAVQGIQLRVCS